MGKTKQNDGKAQLHLWVELKERAVILWDWKWVRYAVDTDSCLDRIPRFSALAGADGHICALCRTARA